MRFGMLYLARRSDNLHYSSFGVPCSVLFEILKRFHRITLNKEH